MLTILSFIFGGIFRLAPEVLKFFDAKNDRKHELDMQDKAVEFQKLKGDQKIEEIGAQGQADWDKGALEALTESIQTQFRPSGVKWVDALSTLIRPLITIQWVILLYPMVIIATFVLAVQSGVAPLVAVVQCFGEPEKALVAAILNFWFIGRVFDRVK
jgi:hypothetical protein